MKPPRLASDLLTRQSTKHIGAGGEAEKEAKKHGRYHPRLLPEQTLAVAEIEDISFIQPYENTTCSTKG